MRPVLIIISLVALATTLLPGFLFFGGVIEHDMVKWLALLGTIVWFVVTPMWMGRPEEMKDEVVVP